MHFCFWSVTVYHWHFLLAIFVLSSKLIITCICVVNLVVVTFSWLLVYLLLYVYFAAYLPLLNKNVSCILMLMCHCCIYYILTWYESVRSLPFSSSVYICCWSVNLVSNPETFAANMLLCVIFSLLIICYCVSQFLAANQLLLATCTFDLNIFYSEEKDWALHWTRHWLPSPGYTTCTHILTSY